MIITDASYSFWFDKVEGYLKSVIEEHPGYSMEDVKNLLSNDILKLHIVRNGEVQGALITIIQQYPRCLEMFIIFAGGNGIDWKEVHKEMTEYARGLGCSQVSFWGRKGWGRHFKGYKTNYIVYSKSIGV